MRIAIVKKACSLRKGGSERYCANLCRQLIQLGHDVTFIGEELDSQLQDEFAFLPVKVNRATTWTKNRSFAENCATVIADHEFDIVHGLSRAYGLDTFRVTDRLQAHWLQVYYRNRFSRFLQGLTPRHRTILELERSILTSSSVRRFVTQSSLDSRLIMQYYGVPERKIRRVYNGVDTTTFHPRVRAQLDRVRQRFELDRSAPLMVFASPAFEHKGLRSVFQAMARSKTRGLQLLVLGDGPIEKFQDVAASLDIGRQIVFAGRQSKIQYFYGAGDLFILPTLYEPFPNVNLEAMACGVPVLTAATTGGADIIEVGKNGYLVEHPDSVSEMTNLIDRHFAQPLRLQRAMSQHCVRVARRMTLADNARRVVQVFEEVLNEKSPSLKSVA